MNSNREYREEIKFSTKVSVNYIKYGTKNSGTYYI